MVTTQNLRLFAIINSTISRLINLFFDFEYQEIYNIVVKAWKLNGIILTATMSEPNFGSDR